ncbi:MAG TPA: hypothetical protein VMZ28_11925 [Kofleriaceae bacterium]|nr:hypothetical protein [Kofleriaceae bacterium]
MTKFANFAALFALLAGATACDMEGLSTESVDDDDSVGETSQELYDPAAPPAPVVTDVCDDSTYASASWVPYTSAHFVVNVLPGTAAETDIASILAKREAAYTAIRGALGVSAEPTITVYLSPNRMAAGAKGKGLGQSFPGQDRIEAVYTGAADSFEVKQHGHLIARDLDFYLDATSTRRHPFLGAGLAEALDQSGRNLHDAYALRVRAGLENRTRLVSLESTDLTGKNTGRAGSLVKYLIDQHGMAAFLEVYKATSLTSAQGCATKNATYGCINSAASLTSMLDGVFKAKLGQSFAQVAAGWKAEVDARMAVGKTNLAAADQTAIKNLVNLMDQAIETGDAAVYRSTMEGFYCEWLGEAGRQDIANRTIETYQGSTSTVMRIYPTGVQNFTTARVLLRRNDERGQLSFHTLSAEKFPQGWRITYGPDWF